MFPFEMYPYSDDWQATGTFVCTFCGNELPADLRADVLEDQGEDIGDDPDMAKWDGMIACMSDECRERFLAVLEIYLMGPHND
jgi:hypothetical protein